MAVAMNTEGDRLDTVDRVDPCDQIVFLLDPTDGAQLVTVPNAARLMNCSTRTISYWIQRGLVDVRRTPTGAARVVVSSLWKRSA